MPSARREAAREVADRLIDDIELVQIKLPEAILRGRRLARLLDDEEASQWLGFEVTGYAPNGKGMSGSAKRLVRRSNRMVPFDVLNDAEKEAGKQHWWVESVATLMARAELNRLILPDVEGSTRITTITSMRRVDGVLANIMAAVYEYALECSVELRFGDTVEDALGTVRDRVDASIAELAPQAATKLSSAFENASSGDAEAWAHAAAGCRRIIKDVADSLRPPGPDVGGYAMGASNYINRLVNWIQTQGVGGTLKDVIVSDLEDFGKRLDAFADAGNKGAHAEVTKYEASRAITGTYLLVGDILDIRERATAATQTSDSSPDESQDKPSD